MSDPSQLSDAQLDAQIAALQAQQSASSNSPANGSLDPSQNPVVVVGQRPGISAPIVTNRTADGSNLQGLSEAQLNALIAAHQNANPNMSGLEDVGRSAVSGLEQGAAGLVALPQTLVDLEQKGIGKLAGMASDFAGSDGQQTYDAFTRHPSDLLFGMRGPTDDQANAAVQSVAGPYHAPQTMAGRYAQTIGQFAPSVAIGPEASIGTKLANLLVPAVASQTAGEATKGTPYEGAARFVGALAGGAGVGAAKTMLNSPQTALGNALGQSTPADFQAAQALRQSAAARGIDITVPEAVQQVTNSGTGLGSMQRVIENTKIGRNLTTPYFASRPTQVSSAVQQLADAIAPPTSQPGMIGQSAQQAATDTLKTARQTVNSVAAPDYQALQSQEMDPFDYQHLASSEPYKVALNSVRSNPVLNEEISQLPDHNLAVVNQVQKHLGTMAEQAAGTEMNPGDKYLASRFTGAGQATDAMARAASPNYGNARDTVANLSQQYVDPLKAGPLGAISKTPEVAAHTAALYPQNPLEGAPSETSQAVQLLHQAAPGVSNDLTRQHIINTFNQSARDLATGPNQYVGAKFANAIAGNPEQASTLNAGVSALPNGQTHAADLADLLDVLRATGKRQAPGSMTAFNEKDLADLGTSPTARTLTNFDIARPFDMIGEGLKNMNYRRNTTRLAELMMSPADDTAATLAKAQASAQSNNWLAQALASAPASQQGQRP